MAVRRGLVLLAVLCAVPGQVEGRAKRSTPHFAALFTLTIRQRDSSSPHVVTGEITYCSEKKARLSIRSPVEQEIWYERGRVTLYYPKENAVIQMADFDDSAAIALDAITALAGPRFPDGVPVTLESVEPDETAETVTMVWVITTSHRHGSVVGRVAVVFDRDGPQSTAMFDFEKRLLRSYEFSSRVRVGRNRIPLLIKARWHDENSRPVKEETWRFEAPKVPEPHRCSRMKPDYPPDARKLNEE